MRESSDRASRLSNGYSSARSFLLVYAVHTHFMY
jgi:hypothetical protein